MQRIIIYSIGAILVYFGLMSLLATQFSGFDAAIIRVTSMIIPQIIMFYMNWLILLPKFFDNNKRKAYYFLTFLLIAFLVGMGYLADDWIDHSINSPAKSFHERSAVHMIIGRVMMLIIPIFVSALISRWTQLQKQKEEKLELRNKVLEAESKALKAQINPHFLFNALNNIYSLSQLNPEKTGDAILHLSDLLRFVTYEGSQDKITLEQEVKLIKSFLSLQELKSPFNEKISIDFSIDKPTILISPLLLLPLIENSFKHSSLETLNGWLKIGLHQQNKSIHFHVSNSITLDHNSTSTRGGIGMDNLRKRLSILYPERHTFNIKITPDGYFVDLELILEE